MAGVIIDGSMLSGLPSGPMTFFDGISGAWQETADIVRVWAPSHGASGLERTTRHLARRRDDFAGSSWYVSVNPTLPMAIPASVRTAVVAHDLRHEVEPDAFSWSSIRYRRLSWSRGLRSADVVFAVSGTTRSVVADRYGIEAVVVPMGADHLEGERAGSVSLTLGLEGAVVAMCHRENKPPELAIAAWRSARRQRHGALPPLCITGLSDARRADLARATPEVADGTIRLFGRLPDADFRHLFRSAAALLFLSSHEGYGLPVAEALSLGVPIVANELPSVREIVGPDAVLAMSSGADDAGTRLATVLADHRPATTPPARWSDAVDVMRRALTPAAPIAGSRR